MILEGTVTNVANFGAFVDIGVHQDGLVHVSQLADRFVKDPSALVKAGDARTRRRRIARRPLRTTLLRVNRTRSTCAKTPHQPKSVPEGAFGAALTEVLRRK
jgi:protein Tex